VFLYTLCDHVSQRDHRRRLASYTGLQELHAYARKLVVEQHVSSALQKRYFESEAHTIACQHLLLSLPLRAWARFFTDINRRPPQALTVVAIIPSECHPRMPGYYASFSAGENPISAELGILDHIPNSALYDSYGIWCEAIDLPDGELFDLNSWRKQRAAEGPRLYLF
jgi:hypothetical protein